MQFKPLEGWKVMLASIALAAQASAALFLGASPVHVDFNAAANGSGAEESPYNNLPGALESVDGGGEIVFQPGLTPGAFVLGAEGASPGVFYSDKAMTLRATLRGPVSLGRSAGFVLAMHIVGGGAVSPSGGMFSPGPLLLEASASSGWSFRRWELDASGTAASDC